MKYVFVIYFLLASLMSVAQKTPLAIADLDDWSSVASPSLSSNGEFLSYYLVNKPKGKSTLILKKIGDTASHAFVNMFEAEFSNNSRFFKGVYINGDLLLFDLVSLKKQVFPATTKRSLFHGSGIDYLCYTIDSGGYNSLFIYNLVNLKVHNYSGISEYYVSKNGRFIVLKSNKKALGYEVSILDLKTWDENIIFSGQEPLNLLVDNNGKQIVFCVRDSVNKKNIFWYYNKDKMISASRIQPMHREQEDISVASIDEFSLDGRYIYCSLERSESLDLRHDEPKVNILTYNSPVLMLNSKANRYTHVSMGIWYLDKNEIVKIQKEGDRDVFPIPERKSQLVTSCIGYKGEWNWNKSAIPSKVLIDMAVGTRKVISESNDRNAMSYVLSPSGRYIVYYDAQMKNYFSINTKNGERINITQGVSAIWTTYDNDDIPFARFMNIGVGGFDRKEEKVYIYDQNDVFCADLNGSRKAVNMTDGYGKRNSIAFRFAFSPQTWDDDRIILTAFNRKTMEDGFFQVAKNSPHSLKELSMQNAIFCGPDESKYISRFLPIKAKDASVYVVRKMSASSSPNFFITKDFVTFDPISNEYPEKKFNWITSELMEFRSLDGKKSKGILYKPENFDPTRRYPLIIYYYEKISECLNFYLMPQTCSGPINIPYFVSNGYIVYTPDIHFEIGYPGRSSLNIVMGAVEGLSKFPYIDSLKIGVQGHSFGGFQTNYIITHTNRFAAACSAAGFTNYVSAYGSVIGDGVSRQGQYELYRDRIGASLWQRPDLYLENSPVMRIDQIKTPLLLMHNEKDRDVPVGQGFEFYTGLRRLGKVAYFLQYKGEGHSLSDKASEEDYTLKMMSFFNYYLRGYPLPNWMTDKKADILSFNPVN